MTINRTLAALAAASGLSLALAAPAFAEGLAMAPADAPVLHVTRTATCGCCGAWVDLARERGFRVEEEITEDYVGMKEAAGIPEDLWACHTAEIAGYSVEGHVPFEAVLRLLEERPEIAGISVPGMPAGSPGMGDDPSATYDVIAHGGTAGAGELFLRAGE